MKKILRRTLIILFGLIVAAAFVLLSAPCLLDAFVLPRLLARVGLPEKSVELLRLSPSRLLGSVEVRDGDIPLLTIPRLEIGYTPGSLLHRRVTRLVLDHATLHLELRDGRPVLPAFPGGPAQSKDAGRLLLSPLSVDEVILKSCSLIVHEQGQPDLRMGLTGRSSQQFSPAGREGYRLRSFLGTFVFSDAIGAVGTISMEAGDQLHEMTLTLENGRLAALDRFLPTGLDSSMFGTLSLTSSLALSARTLTLEHVATSGSLSHFHPVFAGFAGSGVGASETVEFSFSGSSKELDYRLSGLRMTGPVLLSAALHGSAAVFGDGAVRIDGSIDTILGGVPHVDKAGIAIPGTYHATFSAEGFDADLSVTSRPPPLGDPETPLDLSVVSATARLVGRGDRISAHLSGAVPELSLPSRKLLLSDIALELPVELSAATARPAESGSFSVGEVSLNGAKLLTLVSSITQQGKTFRLNGSARALFDPELKTSFSGSAEPRAGRAELSWSLPDTGLSSSSLPPEIGIPESVSFDTRLAAGGTIGYGPEGFACTARGAIKQATFDLPEKSLTLQGVDCTLELPQLPELVSSPSQRCAAAAIDVGKLHFSDTAITFRIEDAETLFIEESRTNWCQGTVESGSLRLSADNPVIDTTLYCSRINMAELLNQFGLDRTKGQGALSGRLPVRLSEKGLRFEDGFLFSTPGTGGIVRLTNTDILRRGMADVGEAGRVSYSLKALEDFAYDWTRLSFNTEGDDLLLAMNLEGKPRTPLPFGFKDGQIVETERGEGLQYPIRLDVNFRLPLAQLFRFGQNIKSLMENK